MLPILKKAKRAFINDMDKPTLAKVINDTSIKFKELMAENKDASRLQKRHYKNNLFPTISLFYALLNNGFTRDKARELSDKAFLETIMDKRKMLIVLMKIPGMYKLYPTLFRKMQAKMFSSELGFQCTYHEASKTRCRFDMTKCFYHATCLRYNCPELCKSFCHSDDLTSDGIHKNIIWHRTKTIGNGDELCDFEIKLK